MKSRKTLSSYQKREIANLNNKIWSQKRKEIQYANPDASKMYKFLTT